MTRLPFRAVHQIVSNFDLGDAIGNHVRALQKLLRSWGYASDVYAQYRHMSLLKDAHFYTTYRAVSSPDTVALFHFSIGSEVTSFFASLPDRRAIVYHNITPPEYFVGVNARVADRCRRGRWSSRSSPFRSPCARTGAAAPLSRLTGELLPGPANLSCHWKLQSIPIRAVNPAAGK